MPRRSREAARVLAFAWARVGQAFSKGSSNPIRDHRELEGAVAALHDACGEWLAVHRDDMHRIVDGDETLSEGERDAMREALGIVEGNDV